MIYDTIIIGGGLAGTNLANKLFNSNRDNFLLFESRSYLGGRVKTVYGKNYYYEAGGARFNGNHKNLIKLLKKYEIEKYKIPSNWQNINFKYNDQTIEYQDVNDLVTDLIKLGESKPNSFLQKHHLHQSHFQFL